ncbi:MAG TPA: glycogen debranching protein, partial [Verrucomicrobiae bacterium]
ADAALPLFKGALLDSMYLGLCPGNVGLTTFFDAYRRETQRDFGDAVGSLSRALVQGLFGIEPDALAGELKLRPGFPQTWNRASIQHPDLTFRFDRNGLKETWFVEQRFEKPLQLRLQISALRDHIANISANGQTVKWRVLEDSIGVPRIEIEAPAARRQTIKIEWTGAAPRSADIPKIVALGSKFSANAGAKILEIHDPQNVLREPQISQNSISGIAQGTLGQRTLFAKVEQGSLRWWQALDFELRPAWEIIPTSQDATHSQFHLRNNTAESWNGNVSIQVNSGAAKLLSVNVPEFQESPELSLPANELVPGANVVRVDFPNGQSASNWIVNWNIPAAGSRFETIDLSGAFNDQVTRIFENEYLAPRSPFCSLATPKQGIGSWCHPADNFKVDDRGLRSVAAAHEGRFTLPQGIPFQTPTEVDAKNILFTSQWNNFPTHASVPLSGKSSHAYLLMAGSTSAMQSRFDNGEVIVTYADNSTAQLALENPINWWPIDQDYFIDDFAFSRPEPIPPRVELKTGKVRVLDVSTFKAKGRTVPGGAATVLDLPLDSKKELKSVTVHTSANEVVIGVMAITLAR